MLTEKQIKLAEQLLLSIKKNEYKVEYNELASRISPPMHWRQVGKEIGEISKLCYKLGLPFISAMVINKNTTLAGEGFYQFYNMYGIDTKGMSEFELWKQEMKKIRECTQWYKLADYLDIEIDLPRPKEKEPNENNIKISDFENKAEFIENSSEQSQIFPEEIPLEISSTYCEGAKKQIIVNAYERNPKARRDCIKAHGDSCIVCGFNSENFYGNKFKGKIHVHHKKPLSKIDNNYVVDPIKDLAPVCPNCHMIIHSKGNDETYTIEEVKQFITGK